WLEAMENGSFHTYFVLNGFDELGVLRPLLFLPFSFAFLVSLLANGLLVYVVFSQRSLHQPMSVLIAGMAVVEVCLPVFFVPNMLLSFLFGWRDISLIGCLTQMHFIHTFGAFQTTFLVWMALDRYFAICRPLYYHQQMALQSFIRFVVPLVLRNVVVITLLVALAGARSFCSDVIHHCVCEHMALVELACGSTALNSLAGLMAIFLIPLLDFLIISASYIVIFSTVLSSARSGGKALHTCVTHIMVLSLSLTVALVAFLSYRVRNSLPTAVRVFFSTMYLLFPSCVNPIIYGIRTTEIRQHIMKTQRFQMRIMSVAAPET
uniref:G-protein coupled receptors family 1 profile domain-containing protein n=1 Tax=Oryzias latipes TaxID=8090 RepID=H2N2Q5_ORYLA